MTQPSQQVLIPIGMAARLLNVSRDRLHQLEKQGRIKAIKDALGRRLFTNAEVKRLVEYRKTHPNSWPEKNGP